MENEEIEEAVPISVKKLKSLMIARRDYLVGQITASEDEKRLFKDIGGIRELSLLINGVLNLELKHNQEKSEEEDGRGRERTITDEHERKLKRAGGSRNF